MQIQFIAKEALQLSLEEANHQKQVNFSYDYYIQL